MSYPLSLLLENQRRQSQATQRLLQSWVSNPSLSVRKLAKAAGVGTATSRHFLAKIKNPSTTVLCIVKHGFCCAYQGRVFKAGSRLQLSLDDYLKRQVQVRVLCLR